MISLAYFSTATSSVGQADLGAILEVSRRNNAAVGVTGVLCHIDGSFLQFLEGEERVMRETFARISRDRRHIDLIKVHEATIAARAFGPWTMGLVSAKEVDSAHRAFCSNLRDIEIATSAEHRQVLEGLLTAFRAWLR